MRKQISESPIAAGQHYLKNHELDAALSTMQQLYTDRQVNEGSDFSIPAQLLWCKILLAKSRFTGNPSYATMALNKLEELSDFIPAKAFQNAPEPLIALQAQAHLLLNNQHIVQQLANQLLEMDSLHLFVVLQAHHLLGKVAIKGGEEAVALQHIRSAQNLLLQQSFPADELVLIQNYLLLSEVLYLQKEYDQALHYSQKIITAAEKNTSLEEYLIKALLIAGSCANHQKEYDIAIQHLLNAKNRSQHIQHYQLIQEAELRIGVLYNSVMDYHRAIQSFSKLSATSPFFLHNKSLYLHFHLEWAKAYYYTQQYEQAKALFERVTIPSNDSRHLKAKAIALAYLSCISTSQQEFQHALRLAKKCNQVLTKISGDAYGSQINLINLGIIHFQLGKYSESIKLTSRGIATAKRLGDELSEIKGYQLMSKIFQQQKDYKNAFLYQSIYTKFYEDFFVKNIRQKVRDLEHTYELEQVARTTSETDA